MVVILIGGTGYSKTKSLPLLRSGPLPFTGPRVAMVFEYPVSAYRLE